MNAAPQIARPPEAAAPLRSRRLLCCIVGGDAQLETTTLAAELATDVNARPVNVSGEDLQHTLAASERRWSGRTFRTRGLLRGDWPGIPRATFLDVPEARSFGSPVRSPPSRPGVHTMSSRIAPAGPDLLIVPAGVGEDGGPSRPAREIAAALARARVCPVLRVRRRPAAMRGWLLLVAGAPGCDRLAAGLLRSGLWPSAAVSILPVADYRPRIRAMVEAQAELLRAHGRTVSIMKPIDLDFEAPELAGRIGRFDAAVASGLSNRACWPFGTVRDCALETVAETAPLLLVP